MVILALVRKVLRDLRVAWILVAVLLFLFQILWSRITERVSTEIVTTFQKLGVGADLLKNIVFSKKEMPGQLVQAVIGGDNIHFDRARDLMSVSYVHPLVLTILGIWAIGRSANALAGEIDRGTMELLLAQPIRRTEVIFAHVLVDVIVFPTLCLAMWLGTYCGTWWMGLQDARVEMQRVNPMHFLPALPCVLAFLFATSGVTLWISSMGRSQARVWGWGVSLHLLMFLVNVLGQIWSPLEWVRPLMTFYHYQPQLMILEKPWYGDAQSWLHLGVLGCVSLTGYLLAWLCFCKRDLPAPL